MFLHQPGFLGRKIDMGPYAELNRGLSNSQEGLGYKQPVHMQGEPTKGVYSNPDVEVSIPEGTKSATSKISESQKTDPDLTESSSDFDSDGISFREVDPELGDDASSAFPFHGNSDRFPTRNKTMQEKWREHMGPLRWRCKWVELQMMKFKSQAREYDKLVAEHDGREQLENHGSENADSKPNSSFVLSQQNALMKRNKRRAEDTEDISSYMSQHNLFSYFENKKSGADVGCTDGNRVIQGAGKERAYTGTNGIELHNEEFIFGQEEFSMRDNALSDMFGKIGVMQRQVSQMKTRAHKVLYENALQIRSTENQTCSVKKEGVLAEAPSSAAIQPVCDSNNTKLAGVVKQEPVDSLAIGGSSNYPSRPLLTYTRRAKKSKKVNTVIKKEAPDEDNFESFTIIPSSQGAEPSLICSKSITTTSSGSYRVKRKRLVREVGSGEWSR